MPLTKNQAAYISVEYKVSLLTTNIYFGGTGSDIFYTFVGLRGSTPEHPAPGDKYLGELDTLTFTDNTEIGKFICLNIRMDGSDAWHIQEVEQKKKTIFFQKKTNC